jgi:hypothetical protein
MSAFPYAQEEQFALPHRVSRAGLTGRGWRSAGL